MGWRPPARRPRTRGPALSGGVQTSADLDLGPRPGPTLLYRTIRDTVRWLFQTVYDSTILHLDRVPESGALLILCNHQSYLDPPLVGSTVVRRELDFFARAGLFRNPAFGWLIRALNSIPVDVENGRPSKASIRAILDRLERGRAVLMFPEGARSSDGHMQPFERGCEFFVKRTGCAVLPAAVEGCFHAWPRGRAPRLWEARVGLAFGHPMTADEFLAPPDPLARLRHRIDELLEELHAAGVHPWP